MNLVIFLAISYLGYRLFILAKIPVPALLGPIAMVSFANLLGLNVSAPAFTMPFFSMVLGLFLGQRFNFKVQGMWKETVLVVFWIIGITILSTQVLIWMGVSPETALFSSMPGGAAEVTVVAMSFGANLFEVTLLQSSRIIFTLIIIPFFVHKMDTTKEHAAAVEMDEIPLKKQDWVTMVAFAGIGAYVFKYFHLPAPYLFGAMLASTIYLKARGLHPPLNKKVQQFAQIGIGGVIGLNVTQDSLFAFPRFIPAILMLNILLVGSSLLVSLYLYRVKHWDRATSILAVAPAGLTVLTVMALEMEADVSKVALLQILRVIMVIFLSPLEGHFFLTLL